MSLGLRNSHYSAEDKMNRVINFNNAVLCHAMLCYAVLCCAMLCYVVLCCAMLCYVVLCDKDLQRMKEDERREGTREVEGGRKMEIATESQEPPFLILVNSPFPLATAEKDSHSVGRAIQSAISSITSSSLALTERSKHHRLHSHSLTHPPPIFISATSQ